jgi:hypothetical protein
MGECRGQDVIAPDGQRVGKLEEAAARKAQDASTHANQASGAHEEAEADKAEHHRLLQEVARRRAQAW